MSSKAEHPKKDDRLYLIDGSALAYRSHFAFIRNPLTNSRGEPTSAVFGFVRALLQIIDDENPSHLAVVFDTRKPTFRHKAYKEYKATREKMPEDLVSQLPKIRQFSEALGIPLIEKDGYEADDVMGTLAKQAAARGTEVYLCTSDKDLMQLVDSKVSIYYTGRNNDSQILDPTGVREKLGVLPEKVIDYLALIGDTSDNVPGIPKIGPKTATKLLDEFGSLEEILSRVAEIKRKSIKETIETNRDTAILSKKLVTIETAVPIEASIDDLEFQGFNTEKIVELCKELDFNSILPRFVKTAEPEQADYRLLDTPAAVEKLVADLKKVELFAFDTETTSADPLQAELVGFSFSWEQGKAYYVPVAPPSREGDLSDFFLDAKDGDRSFSLKQILGPVLEDEQQKKCGQNAKYDILVISRYGIEVKGVVFDTMIASYVLSPGQRQHNLDALCLEQFNYRKIPTSELIGSGKKQITMREVPVEKVAKYAGEDADFTFRLYKKFNSELEKGDSKDLYDKIEIPLVAVLTLMERHGIALDLPFLEKMSNTLKKQIDRLIEEIYELAGEEFNINSNQQLAEILFEKLKLPRKRRTKTGYSTDANVLAALAPHHDLPSKLLEYRELTKLKSTYVDALPQLVNPITGRLHTSFNQTIAATGRLSSSDPNLQNIPIRTEAGRKIRQAFVPRDQNWLLLDADYSQIELRLMAHLSQDEAMIEAFRNDEDIHAATASLMFGLDLAEITPDLRRRAKEINFGILYGMGAYGLARRLEISVEEAQNFINNYFIQYPGVNQFIIGTISDAHQKGYVTTMFHRRRYLPDINSSNNRTREAAERTAINTPIQGTAADLIKIAMINIHERMQAEKLAARMLLQVHDELVFEAPQDEIERLRALVVEEMRDAVRLDVPIKIEVGTGENWLEAH